MERGKALDPGVDYERGLGRRRLNAGWRGSPPTPSPVTLIALHGIPRRTRGEGPLYLHFAASRLTEVTATAEVDAPGSCTGWGLSLSYDIVAQGHAGSITVDRETDGGSTFIVTLPSSGQS